MGIIQVPGYICERCGYKWAPRVVKKENKMPKICPECNSPYWNEARGPAWQKKYEEKLKKRKKPKTAR